MEGLVASLTDSSITVTTEHDGDVTVGVTADTVIRKGDAAATLADIQVGDKVDVKAQKDSTGGLVALGIKVESPGSGDMEIEASGAVTAVSATSITVHSDGADVTFDVTATTVVRSGANLLTIADVHIGDQVEVKGVKTTTENTALFIQIEHD